MRNLYVLLRRMYANIAGNYVVLFAIVDRIETAQRMQIDKESERSECKSWHDMVKEIAQVVSRCVMLKIVYRSTPGITGRSLRRTRP